MNKPRNKALFIDRDNTIIYDAPYMADPENVKIMPKVTDALCEFRKAGYMLIIVTNQSGIGRGMFSEKEMFSVHQRMTELFNLENVAFDDILYCPHAPEEHCTCRKPLPGMLLEAAEKHNIDLSDSIMIGDKIADVDAGLAAGCKKNVWLSHGRKQIKGANKNFIITENLWEASLYLLSNSKG